MNDHLAAIRFPRSPFAIPVTASKASILILSSSAIKAAPAS